MPKPYSCSGYLICHISCYISIVFLLVAGPTVKATTGGPLEELGDLLGIDKDGSGESSRIEDPNNVESVGGSLPIPNITQREEPPAPTSSGSVQITDEFVMNAEYEPHEFLEETWEVNAFGFDVSLNSTICPTGNCEFELEDGQMKTLMNGDWELTGRLKVGVETEEGLRSTIHDVRGELDREETLESGDTVTDMLGGEFRLGSGLVILPQDIDSEYEITNGTFAIEDEDATLILRGIKQ